MSEDLYVNMTFRRLEIGKEQLLRSLQCYSITHELSGRLADGRNFYAMSGNVPRHWGVDEVYQQVLRIEEPAPGLQSMEECDTAFAQWRASEGLDVSTNTEMQRALNSLALLVWRAAWVDACQRIDRRCDVPETG